MRGGSYNLADSYPFETLGCGRVRLAGRYPEVLLCLIGSLGRLTCC
jgi:hypothetical protein